MIDGEGGDSTEYVDLMTYDESLSKLNSSQLLDDCS